MAGLPGKGRPRQGGPAVVGRARRPLPGYLPRLEPGPWLAPGAGLVNRWRGVAAGACRCAVLTRVTVMAVSKS